MMSLKNVIYHMKALFTKGYGQCEGPVFLTQVVVRVTGPCFDPMTLLLSDSGEQSPALTPQSGQSNGPVFQHKW